MKFILNTREIDLATDLPTLKESIKNLLDDLLFRLNIPYAIDANTLNGFSANQMPIANTIPVADNLGKLTIEWLKFNEFSATMSANQTIPTNTWTTIAFNSVICNPYNNYNSSTYSYVSPVNGYYFLSSTVRWKTAVSSSGYVWQMAFYKNGVQIPPVWDFGGSGYTVSGTISTVYYLASGDNVNVRVYQNYSSNSQISMNSVFCGFRIS